MASTGDGDDDDGRPWAPAEHHRFLAALEQFGCGQSSSVAAAWLAIATSVGSRGVAAVKAHAQRYYAQLQSCNAHRRKEYLAMQQVDTRWTLAEDARLEALLARVDGAFYPWDEIAGQLGPLRTAVDARERYHKLCYDVARIESGQHVMMHLARHPRPRATSTSTSASTTTSTSTSRSTEEEEQPIDCVVALTAAESEALLLALEQVDVPAAASPDALASVASAVAALACGSNRRPPQRATPRFSLDEARRALQRAIAAAAQSDPHAVLARLVDELWLRQKRPLSYGHNQIDLSSQPPAIVSAGFAFGLSPSFYQYESEATRSAAELLQFKASPVHSREPQQRTDGGFSFSFLPSPSPTRSFGGFGSADGGLGPHTEPHVRPHGPH